MSILTGIPRDTVKGVGGILEVWGCLLSDISSGVTMSGGTAHNLGTQAGVWKQFVLGKEAGSNFVSTMTGNITNGSNVYENVLTMIFKRNQVAKRNEAKVLAQNETVWVISDNAVSDTAGADARVGDLFIIGLPLGKAFGGSDITSKVTATGAQFADANNMTVVARALENYETLSISESDFTLIRSGSAVA